MCDIAELFTNPDADDLQFAEDMIARVEAEPCVDREHVFATGFSMGGYFTNNLACQRPGLLRAAAPNSSGTYVEACHGNVPTLIIHGSGDPGVDFECGLQTRDLWLERNGCARSFDEQTIERGHCEQYRSCEERGQVTFCVTDDVCHGWARHGTGDNLCLSDFGAGPSYEDATKLIWRFFVANW